MTLLWRHRFGALVLAVLLHAGIGAALGWHIAPPPATGTGTGEHGIEIALGSVSAAAGSVDSVASTASATQAPPPPEEANPAPEATPEVAKNIPVEHVPSPVAPARHALALAPPDRAPPDAEIAAAIEPPPAEQTPEPVNPEVAPVAPSETASPPEPSQATAHPVPKPQRKPLPPAPEQTAALTDPVGDRPPAEQSAASVAGAGGVSGSADRGSQETELASTGPSGASGTVAADYYALLRGWLEKHKEYPRRAKRRRQQGTAMLFFVMARDGRVLDYRIRRSSGFKILDGEVEDMIRRAQPLPPMPGEFEQSRLELVVPIEFSIR